MSAHDYDYVYEQVSKAQEYLINAYTHLESYDYLFGGIEGTMKILTMVLDYITDKKRNEVSHD